MSALKEMASIRQRLIRFKTPNEKVFYGHPILPLGVTDIALAKKAHPVNDHPFLGIDDASPLRPALPIQDLLAPLSTRDRKGVRCLGLNYAQHAKEANLPIPRYPVLFYKPMTSICGPRDYVSIPYICQETEGLDYECELVAVIGKKTRNVSPDQALSYVFGYCVGNDVSHREWQFQRGGGQWGIGKGFDKWAPIGPGIVSTSLIPNPQNLEIKTLLNGKEVQNSNTKDMIFSVAEIVSFLSQGTTLLPGDLIMTGTPQGVGMARNPPLWLRDNDVVEVYLEGVGTCRNRISFDKRPKEISTESNHF